MQRDDLISGRFRLTRQTGHHWLAQDQRTRIECLIIPLEDFTDNRVVHWLEQIWHPGLPRVLDQVRGPDDRTLVVLEYMPGQALADYLTIRRHRKPDRLLALIKQAAHLLAFLHEASDPPLMHLDLKPEHWLVLPTGDLGLIDFQTAVFYDGADYLSSERRHRRLSLAYAAPELLADHPCPASDLYALALICLQYLTGRPPEFCRNHAPQKLLPERLAQLADLLAHCLADDLAARPTSTTQFITTLDSIIKQLAEPSRGWRRSSDRRHWLKYQLKSLPPNRFPTDLKPEINSKKPAAQFSRICIWQDSELACELAAVWSQRANVLLLDGDLQDPRCGAYLRPGTDLTRLTPHSDQKSFSIDTDSTGRYSEQSTDCAAAWPVSIRRSLDWLDTSQCLAQDRTVTTTALLQLLSETESQYDCCLTVASGLTHDAVACILLLTADLIVMPIRANSIHWQSRQRQIKFLASKGIVVPRQILYVLFPYQSQRELSLASIRALTGTQLAGVISDCPERDRHRGSHRPYWSRMIRRNNQEYLRLINSLQDRLL